MLKLIHIFCVTYHNQAHYRAKYHGHHVHTASNVCRLFLGKVKCTIVVYINEFAESKILSAKFVTRKHEEHQLCLRVTCEYVSLLFTVKLSSVWLIRHFYNHMNVSNDVHGYGWMIIFASGSMLI